MCRSGLKPVLAGHAETIGTRVVRPECIYPANYTPTSHIAVSVNVTAYGRMQAPLNLCGQKQVLLTLTTSIMVKGLSFANYSGPSNQRSASRHGRYFENNP